MTRKPLALLTPCLVLLAGCQSGPLGLFAHKDKTTYQTPKLRMESAVAAARQATGEDTPEQREAVVDLARRLQTEPDPLVRCALVRAIGKFNTPLAPQVLRAGLQDSDALVRRQCCETIGERHDNAMIDALAAVARQDEDHDVQIEAVRALGKLPSPETAAALVAALESDDPAMQYAGVQAMKQATGKNLGGDVRAYLAYAKGESPEVGQQPPAVATRFGRWLPF